jgi:DNA-binding NarL/FixJ family response regulator
MSLVYPPLLYKLIDYLPTMTGSSPTISSTHLTDREQRVLELVLKVRSNSAIVSQLGIGQRTVKRIRSVN